MGGWLMMEESDVFEDGTDRTSSLDSAEIALK